MISTEQSENEVVRWTDLAIQLCAVYHQGLVERALLLFLLNQISLFQEAASLRSEAESAPFVALHVAAN